MNIGYMDRRITVQEDTGTANAYGEVSSTWSDVATVWAAMDITTVSYTHLTLPTKRIV